ncbi:hypothetical protein GCM10027451_45910 [Geodermatophilus aquaeductus]
MPHAGGRGGVDEGAVLVDPVGRLRRRHHEDRADALQRPPDGVPVAVGRDDGGGAGQPRRPRGVADQQPQRNAGGGEPLGDAAADLTGGAGDGDGDL